MLSGLTAVILGWAASVLPWRQWTVFSAITAAVAIVHGATAVVAATGSSRRGTAWRVQSMVALAFLAYLSWGLVRSATYVAVLYGGLGRGVAAGLAVCWGVLVLITVPLSVWGIAATGGIRSRRRAAIGAGLAVALSGTGLASAAASAGSERLPGPTLEDLRGELPPPVWAARVEVGRPSLWTVEPATCELPPGLAHATVIVTYLDRSGEHVEEACLQGTPSEVTAGVRALVADEAARAPVKLDVITARQVMVADVPVLDSLKLRPGLDGVCSGSRCLMPWQLVAGDAFVAHTPIPVIRDLRFGVAPGPLRERLEPGADRHPATLEGLVRIETASSVLGPDGEVHPLDRMRSPGMPSPDPAALERATAGAEAYVLSAQGQDGRFRYKLDPFTGRESYRGFSIPRQAGTTLALCELGVDGRRVRRAAKRSLRQLASLERRAGDVAGLYFPRRKRVKKLGLGPTALSLVAFVTCRDRVGQRKHDAFIGRMARFLLAMQRPDGGFHPRYDLAAGEPVVGPDPLYAGGQAVLALTLLERIAADETPPDWPDHATLRDAVERSMDYFSGPYWDHFTAQFFFLEENWHCLAARAALEHHRHDGYERLCLDYVTFKRRLILDGHSRVRDDLLGGYGFGNVLVPHNTATAGFGEALAAAMAVKRARGLDLTDDREAMGLVLGFLLHHQWDDVSCFACTPEHRVVGAFSEHMASPVIRIDYVQHAWAALGHGGAMLGV